MNAEPAWRPGADPPRPEADESERARRALLSLLEDQQLAQEALQRVNRALKTLSAGNSAVVHAQNEAALLQSMCEVIIRSGYGLAWVGLAQQESGGSVRPVAMAGNGATDVQRASVGWDGSAHDRGPIERCLREGSVQVVHDIAADPALAPWHEMARQHGYASIVVFPLAGPAGPFGALAIYARERTAFDDDEMALLAEMAGELAYGVMHLREQQARLDADAQIRVLARFPEESPSAVMRLDAKGVLLYANPASAPFLQGCGGRVGDTLPEPCRSRALGTLEAGAIKREELALGDRLYGVTFAPIRDLNYVNVYAGDITERRRAEESLRASLIATVRVLASTVEARDPYTAGHQRRVASIAGAIARSLDWNADRIQGLELAATIHDVGKINVPAEILAKPTKLTAIEHELVKIHPEAGYEILKDVVFPWPIAQVVRQHHERLDGSGYPGGLKGDAILPEARILAVADVVEAVASHRPYRAAKGLDAALAEIARGRGVAFDAAAVDACMKLFREAGFRIPD